MSGTARQIVRAGLFVLAFSAGSETAGAQRDLLGPGAAFFALGVSGISTGELDDRLTAEGYSTFGETAVGASIGAYRTLSSGVMLGAEWHGLVFEEGEQEEGREVGLGGGYATLGIGYMVEVSRRARVYPRLGLGGGGLGLWFENEEDDLVFDDVLANPQPAPDDDDEEEAVLNSGSVVLDLGAGAEFLPSGRTGPVIGLRLGYLAAPFTTDWWMDEREVNGGPEVTIAGPYIRLVVGVAWRE